MSQSQKRTKVRYTAEQTLQIVFEQSLDFDFGELSGYKNEEDGIPRNAAKLVPVNEVIGVENEAGDVQDAFPSSNIPTSNSGSTRHVTRRAQREFGKDNEDSDLEEFNWSIENEIESSDTEAGHLSDIDDNISIDEHLLQKHKCSWRKATNTQHGFCR